MEIVYDDAGLTKGNDQHGRALGSLGKEGGQPEVQAVPCWSTASWKTRSKLTSTCCVMLTGEVVIGGVMEHVEQAGIHSGDSACAFCPRPR